MARTIYFATNRNITQEVPLQFGKGFSTNGLGDMRFGRAGVTDGSLDHATIELLPDTPTDGSEKLFAELRKTMRVDRVDSLFFIHGFNVSFDEAIESAAKMGDMYFQQSGGTYEPNIFVFSWPSDGQLMHYHNDRHDAQASGYALARAMLKLARFLKYTSKEDACQQQIHLIAHSMGNYVLRNALQQIGKIVHSNSLTRIFNNIILTAADEDNDAFEHDHKLARLPELAQRVTVYFNNGDNALAVSDYTKGNPDRLGHDGPNKPHNIPAKVVLVDVSSIISGIVEHSYHQEDAVVAKDIIAILRGKGSEEPEWRQYVPHANKFKLIPF